MKLMSIKLCNFRQFYGKTPEIVLACGERNTTILFMATTEQGKHTLLNAFTWVLYENLVLPLLHEDKLVNKQITENRENQWNAG